MNFRIGRWEISIRKRAEDEEEIKGILKDPNIDKILALEEAEAKVLDYLKEKGTWCSRQELTREMDLGRHDWRELSMASRHARGGLIEESIEQKSHEMMGSEPGYEHYYKYHKKWSNLFWWIFLGCASVLNIFSAVTYWIS